jgi:putative ABC transport system permease protein
MMLNLTLRDIQYRKRQFAIAIIGAGLVFALALLLSGVRSGFDTEARGTVEAIGADGWVVQDGVSGPFTSVSGLPAETAELIADSEGVSEAAPFAAFPNTLNAEDDVSVNLIGIEPGALGAPVPDQGDPLAGAGELVVDQGTGASVGEMVSVAGRKFEIVGTVEDRTYFGGQPVVYMTLSDAQQLAFNGEPLSNAIIFTGTSSELPAGLTVLSNSAVQEDMKLALGGAIDTINLLRILMWIVAAVIIGAVIYLSALERTTDFAVLKAVGGESHSLALGLSVQAILVSLMAALLAIGISALLRPGFPLPTTIGIGSYLALIAIACLVGALASLAALRRVLKVDPALAFG